MVARVTDRLGPPDVLVHNALADFAFNGDARSHLDRLTLAEIACRVALNYEMTNSMKSTEQRCL